MADREPDYGEEDYATMLRVLRRVAAGASLQAAARKEDSDAAMVLDIALRDSIFARAILVAQNERLHGQLHDIRFGVAGIESAAGEIAANTTE